MPKLHRTIQIVMGWTDCNRHKFHIAGQAYGSCEQHGASVKDERRTLGELVPFGGGQEVIQLRRSR